VNQVHAIDLPITPHIPQTTMMKPKPADFEVENMIPEDICFENVKVLSKSIFGGKGVKSISESLLLDDTILQLLKEIDPETKTVVNELGIICMRYGFSGQSTRIDYPKNGYLSFNQTYVNV
jgi:hypothetical protein